LLKVNNVELAGESPNITATMDITIVILPRDSDNFKSVPLATDTSGGGGGGAPYGPGGGAPPYGGPGGGPFGPGGGANGGGGNGGGANGGS
jgi:hypothetical protein